MIKQKVVVMKVTGNKTIVYTEQGDFLKIPTPAQTPLVGQAMDLNLKNRSVFAAGNWVKYFTAAAALFLILAPGFMHQQVWPLGGAVAAVELNINDGLSLQVNREGYVTGVYNAGSESGASLDELPVKGLDVYQAVKLIVAEAGLKGDFSHEQNLVMVSVIPVSKSSKNVVDPDILRGVVHEELLKQNANGMVMVGSSNNKAISKAQDLGMTVNNYLVYERCRQDGIDVQADIFRGRNVRDAMAEADVSISKLFPGEYMEIIGDDGSQAPEEKVIVRAIQQVLEPETELKADSDLQQNVSNMKRVQPGSRGTPQRINSLPARADQEAS